MLIQSLDLVEYRDVLSHGIPNCAFVQSADFCVCPEIIIVVDLQIGSVRDVDLLAFDIPAPREHLRVCPLTVATAKKYAVYLFELVSLYRRTTQLRESI